MAVNPTTVCLNASLRALEYWTQYKKPLPWRYVCHNYARALGLMGRNTQWMLDQPEFRARTLHVLDSRARRYIVPRDKWEALSFERQTELLESFLKSGRPKATSHRAKRYSARKTAEPRPELAYLPMTDAVPSVSIEDIVAKRLRGD